VVGRAERGILLAGTEVDDRDAAQDLQAAPVRVVDQDQRGPVVMGQVADADVLAVAGKVGKGQRGAIHYLEKAGRPAAVLNMRPARFADGGEIEAVARRNELALARSEFNVRLLGGGRQFAAAIAALAGLDAGGVGEGGEVAGHDALPIFVAMPE